jgi:PII-like signaling protein
VGLTRREGRFTMRIMEDAVLLRIFLGEDDMREGQPLYRLLLEAAMQQGMAGGTVLPAPMGFGISRNLRSGLNPDAGASMPIVVEIIDRPEKIDAFLPLIEPMIDSGMITMESLKARLLVPPGNESRLPS